MMVINKEQLCFFYNGIINAIWLLDKDEKRISINDVEFTDADYNMYVYSGKYSLYDENINAGLEMVGGNLESVGSDLSTISNNVSALSSVLGNFTNDGTLFGRMETLSSNVLTISKDIADIKTRVQNSETNVVTKAYIQ